MFSFSTISVFATVALSAFTSAIPLASRQLPAVGDLAGSLPVVNGLTGALGGVLPRADATTSLAAILSDAQTQLAPLTAQLKFANKQNATVEGLTTPVNNIKAVLTATTARVNALAGLPQDQILAAVDGAAAITVAGLAEIVATLLTDVFTALVAVLAVVDGDVVPAVTALLAAVGALVGTLLTAVLGLVGGLLAALIPLVAGLLGELVPTLLTLNLAGVLGLLGLL
ncbi:hypothetical protein C8Q77DRAFT_1156690 [Trametes polyzona]|nr:hypothetical protein C8Q77DRAFT_1156690 [Trametes polyzona]